MTTSRYIATLVDQHGCTVQLAADDLESMLAALRMVKKTGHGRKEWEYPWSAGEPISYGNASIFSCQNGRWALFGRYYQHGSRFVAE